MIVFIDGENFRQGLSNELYEKHLIERRDVLYKFDVVGLMREALKIDDVEIWYYASEVKMPRGHKPDPEIAKQMCKIERRARFYVPMLLEQGVKYIKAGNLKPKMSGPCRKCGEREEIIQEKGVDVRMALDIFEECLKPEREEIAVMSSDVDLCPVYRRANQHFTRIRYVCFADRMNKAVNASCYKTMTISPDNIKRHFMGVMMVDALETESDDDKEIDDYLYEN